MFLRHTCKLPLKRRGCTPASKGPPSRPVRCVCSWGQGRRCRGQRGTESPPRACHKRSGGRGDVRRPREPSPFPPHQDTSLPAPGWPALRRGQETEARGAKATPHRPAPHPVTISLSSPASPALCHTAGFQRGQCRGRLGGGLLKAGLGLTHALVGRPCPLTPEQTGWELAPGAARPWGNLLPLGPSPP